MLSVPARAFSRGGALNVSELVLFTLNAIVIYLIADRIVRLIERRRGAVLKQRQVVFFGIFLLLALVTFRLLRTLTGDPTP
jgi:hypothetical protein